MKSLRTRFFLFFIGLCIVASAGAGAGMYIQYSNYIQYTYSNTLKSTAEMIDNNYPFIGDIDYLIGAAQEMTPEYREFIRNLQNIAQAYNLGYIYLLQKVPEGYRFIFDAEFLIEEMFEELFLSVYELEDQPDEMDIAYNTGKMQIMKKPYTDEWGTFIGGYLPVIRNNRVVALLALDYEVSFLDGLYRSALVSFLFSLGFAVLLAVILALVLSKSLLTPINQALRMAGDLADMDFAAEMSVTREDEIGAIQNALIKIRDNFRQTLDTLNGNLEQTKNISKTLDVAIEKSSDDLELISNNMDSVQNKAAFQLESVQHTTNSVGQIIRNIESLNKAVQTQAVNITESSASIEQMIANIASIRNVVGEVHKTTDRLTASSDNGQRKLEMLMEEVKRISQQSAALQDANTAISNIAGQTNILAMNAAIEAAHAGDAGKGFAVVADEIRKLAESSAEESTAIAVEITRMQEGIENILEASKETTDTMTEMFNEVNNMSNSFAVVNNAIEEQAAGGTQILRALKTIQDMTEQVRDGSAEIHKGSGEISSEIKGLQSASEEVNESVQGIRQASQHIAESLEEARSISAKTNG
ncbi:methyl-accepting chemotaxis protein [Brucepastera parasyntrophica]|uniref:methyl-accepting chemotaxis protein n=1 Tax=Brucepastera parasyntrophica TaxID=2880008 RepID=UPI00210CB52A|nr:HAMP domain-containing methyl-accepting chemotaxis protein [Brucepastera parasyntrophica]ULQ59190.1 methyl-accepting chemotaxis protein [Brucepastera parasyntrophica]